MFWAGANTFTIFEQRSAILAYEVLRHTVEADLYLEFECHRSRFLKPVAGNFRRKKVFLSVRVLQLWKDCGDL